MRLLKRRELAQERAHGSVGKRLKTMEFKIKGKGAGRGAVAEIIETEEGLPARPAKFLERRRLGAGHVGHETAEKNDPRRLSGEPVVSDCRAVLACYYLRLLARFARRRRDRIHSTICHHDRDRIKHPGNAG